MFDPERKDDDGTDHFYVRVLAIVGVSLAVCIALYPSVIGFPARPEATRAGTGSSSPGSASVSLQACVPAW